MLDGIGKLNTYLQQQNLQTQLNSKGTAAQDSSKTDTQPDSIVDILLATSSSKDGTAQRIAAIRKKLMNGRELTDEELHYLEKNSPELYEKAQKVKEVRERLREDLKHAKTKAEAQRAVTRAQVSVAAAAKAELSGVGGLAASGAINTAGGSAAPAVGDVAAATPAAAALPLTGGAVSTAAAPAVDTASLQATAPQSAASLTTTDAAAGSDAATASATGAAASTTLPATGTSDAPAYDKFVMQLRALQDEWQKFSRSREYKQLPVGQKE